LELHPEAGRNLEGTKMKRTYAVLYENGPNNLSAYVPDLPGCVGVGDTLEEIRENMREAITFHIELMLQHGESVPEPQTSLQRALDLHNEDLSEHHEALSEDLPEPPAIAELVAVDTSPEAIRLEYGHLFPEELVPVSGGGLESLRN
jgi:predicted RNase H-like HicB family nuclease